MTDSPSRPSVLGPSLTFGFGTAVAMWCAWWVTHHPTITAPASVTGPVLLLILLVAMTLAGRSAAPAPGWKVGLGAGVIASLLNLLVVLSFVSRPPKDGYLPAPGFEGLNSDSALAALGFVGLGAVVGLLGGVIGSRLPRREPAVRAQWIGCFAWVACAAVVPLLVVGGAVTSTASGMAVPGWPDTYGANMFLYPIKFMSNPRVFLEHTHRLLGSLVGLTTLTLMVWALLAPVSRAVKAWTIAASVLVCIQGVLGGLRVNNSSVFLAFIHGVSAQLFFAALVCIAMFLSPMYERASRATIDPSDRRRKAFCMGLQHATILQLILGAAYRHFGQAGGSMHALWTHAAFSLIVVVLAIVAGSMLWNRGPRQEPLGIFLRRVGGAMIGVVAVQFLLGWAAFVAVLGAGPRGVAPTAEQLGAAKPIPPLSAVIATLHQANGALLLALATIGVVIMRRVWKSAVASRDTAPQTPDPAAP